MRGGERQSPQDRSGDCGPGAESASAAVPPSGLRQVSLARLAEFGIEPKRDLGQNFLIDDNILGVILGQLESRPDDVVLEVGAGLGVLTAALAGVAARVHAFEIDKSLQPALAATLAGARTCRCTSRTYSRPPWTGSILRPPCARATCRTPWPGRSSSRRCSACPGCGVTASWCSVRWPIAWRPVRVPRRTALCRSGWGSIRGSSGPGSYPGRSSFPQPHVDSTLIVLERRGHDELPAVDVAVLREVVQAAFGQRRKTLANALSAGLVVPREWVAGAVAALGLSPDVRAERLEPAHFVRLAEELRRLRGSSG